MTVSTKLMDKVNYQKYSERYDGIRKAWQLWLHQIIEALNEQRQREDLQDDSAMSGEMFVLLMELDECRKAGDTIFHIFDHDDDEPQPT